MQRILDLKIESPKNYGEDKIFQKDVATALLRFGGFLLNKEVEAVGYYEFQGIIIKWEHSYKDLELK